MVKSPLVVAIFTLNVGGAVSFAADGLSVAADGLVSACADGQIATRQARANARVRVMARSIADCREARVVAICYGAARHPPKEVSHARPIAPRARGHRRCRLQQLARRRL